MIADPVPALLGGLQQPVHLALVEEILARSWPSVVSNVCAIASFERRRRPLWTLRLLAAFVRISRKPRFTEAKHHDFGQNTQRGPRCPRRRESAVALGVFAEFETNLRRERQLEGNRMR
jgi:hypothetical protein